MTTRTYVLSKGGPLLLDLRVPADTLHLVVNGPGMLFAHLQLVTSLGLDQGLTVDRLDAFADAVEVLAFCGNAGTVSVTPRRVDTRVGSYVQIGFGPMGMYQSELLLRTRNGESFQDLIRRSLAAGVPPRRRYLAVLEAVPGTGHHEGPAEPPPPLHPHNADDPPPPPHHPHHG